ncbi:hypothetical protein [Actinobaculum sp. 352]|uniref:hypothetical protein n=1 Tax=Actinobaculum sp. 352 TaxID=2490946 RepID=UPI000F7EC7B8|nr:hypothetical protein [Actinobaculum sp. 352]RTE49189.1 hypothetical protein EKN07_06320 [Actinobaculum sp. 352]
MDDNTQEKPENTATPSANNATDAQQPDSARPGATQPIVTEQVAATNQTVTDRLPVANDSAAQDRVANVTQAPTAQMPVGTSPLPQAEQPAGTVQPPSYAAGATGQVPWPQTPVAGQVPPSGPAPSGGLPLSGGPAPATAQEPYGVATQNDGASSGGFIAAAAAQWTIFQRIFSGQLLEAFKTVESVRHTWLVTIIGTLVASGLGAGVLAGQSLKFLNSIFSFISRLDAGGFIQTFFLVAIVFAIAMFIRILAIKFALNLRHVPVSYAAAGRIYGVAVNPLFLLTVLVLILVIIPTPVTIGLGGLLTALFFPMFLFMAEIMIYIGMNRVAPVNRSLLVPHTLMTGVSAVVTMLVCWAVFEIL